jgi:hypothetical protein
MKHEIKKNPGEVAVNSLESMSEFEKKGIMLLRHADQLFLDKDFEKLPVEIRKLFKQTKTRYQISELINILAIHYRRPIVRHQPFCNCVGADENVFANLITFSGTGQIEDAMLLGSLLINSKMVPELINKATIVADLFFKDLNKNKVPEENTKTQNYHIH